MPLTPVRVRGKRKAPLGSTPLATQHLVNAKKKKPLHDVLGSRSTRYRSSLEHLPVEILETILLHSKNLSLPQTSCIIGAKLSSRATLIRLLIHAFGDTWDQWFGLEPDHPDLHGPRTEDRWLVPHSDGDPVYQTAVLRQPWMHMDLILQAQQNWADRYARGRWYGHVIHPADEDVVPANDPHRQGGFNHFDARACFEFDYQKALKAVSAYPYVTQSMGSPSCHLETRLPEALVTGPWDDDAQRRLFWLSRSWDVVYGPLQEDRYEFPWEIRLECLRNAVLEAAEPNRIAMDCLMGEDFFTGFPYDVARREVLDIQKRFKKRKIPTQGVSAFEFVMEMLTRNSLQNSR